MLIPLHVACQEFNLTPYTVLRNTVCGRVKFQNPYGLQLLVESEDVKKLKRSTRGSPNLHKA